MAVGEFAPDGRDTRSLGGAVPHRFDGRTVVVTGAGSGIGRATAVRLLDEGARVVAADIRGDGLESLEGSSGERPAEKVVADLADPAQLAELVRAAGPVVDGLANVAGIPDGFAGFDDTDDALWERVLSVNLTAVFRLTRDLLPALRASDAAAVVNVGSAASRRGSGAGMAYTVSKHGLLGLTRSAAFLHGPEGIRFNVVAPGAVMTGIDMSFRSAHGQERFEAVTSHLAPTVADPAEVAAPIAYLLSADASNINGTILHVDGGLDAY